MADNKKERINNQENISEERVITEKEDSIEVKDEISGRTEILDKEGNEIDINYIKSDEMIYHLTDFPALNEVLGNIEQVMPGITEIILKRFAEETPDKIPVLEAGELLAKYCSLYIGIISEIPNGIVLNENGEINLIESLKQRQETGMKLSSTEMRVLEQAKIKGTGDALRDYDKDEVFLNIIEDTKKIQEFDKEKEFEVTFEAYLDGMTSKNMTNDEFYKFAMQYVTENTNSKNVLFDVSKLGFEYAIKNKDKLTVEQFKMFEQLRDIQNNEHRTIEAYEKEMPEDKKPEYMERVKDVTKYSRLYLAARFMETNRREHWGLTLEKDFYGIISQYEDIQEIIGEYEERRKRLNKDNYEPHFVKSDDFGYELRADMTEAEVRRAFKNIQYELRKVIQSDKNRSITNSVINNNIKRYLTGDIEKDGLFSSTTKFALSSKSNLTMKERKAFIIKKYRDELDRLQGKVENVPKTMEELFEREGNDPLRVYRYFYNIRKEHENNQLSIEGIKKLVEDESNTLESQMTSVYFLDNGARIATNIKEQEINEGNKEYRKTRNQEALLKNIREQKITDEDFIRCRFLESALDVGGTLVNVHQRRVLAFMDTLSKDVVLHDVEEYKKVQLGAFVYKEKYENVSVKSQIEELKTNYNVEFNEEELQNQESFLGDYQRFAKRSIIYANLENAMALTEKESGQWNSDNNLQLQSAIFVLKALQNESFKDVINDPKTKIAIEQHIAEILRLSFPDDKVVDYGLTGNRSDLSINMDNLQKVLDKSFKENNMPQMSMDDIFQLGLSNTVDNVLEVYAGEHDSYWGLPNSATNIYSDNKRDHFDRRIKNFYNGVIGTEKYTEDVLQGRKQFLEMDDIKPREVKRKLILSYSNAPRKATYRTLKKDLPKFDENKISAKINPKGLATKLAQNVIEVGEQVGILDAETYKKAEKMLGLIEDQTRISENQEYTNDEQNI